MPRTAQATHLFYPLLNATTSATLVWRTLPSGLAACRGARH